MENEFEKLNEREKTVWNPESRDKYFFAENYVEYSKNVDYVSNKFPNNPEIQRHKQNIRNWERVYNSYKERRMSR